MNRILLFKNDLIKNSTDLYLITDTVTVSHLKNVLKVKLEQKIKITLVDNGIGEALIVKQSADAYTVKILTIAKGFPPLFDVIIGLSRPAMLKKILEHGTSFGVHTFHFYKACLSEKSYLDTKVFNPDQIDRYLHAGLAQARDFYIKPQVLVHKNQYELNKNIASLTHHNKWILSLQAQKYFLNHLQKINQDDQSTVNNLLAIGPERGFTPEEEKYFQNLNFTPIKISDSVLRVENASLAALAQLEMLIKTKL